MKKILLALFSLFYVTANASHIVGGEFELIYISKNRYNLRLIYYFDVINGYKGEKVKPADSKEAHIVGIFRKSDNMMMDSYLLDFKDSTRLSYYQPECSKGEVITDRFVFSKEITMSDDEYGDPAGYYVIWERCCRNYDIVNIFSEKPPVGSTNFPTAAGQTFYLEFPPVIKNGKEFINSTPQLFPPLNDYACPNKFFYANFAGSDVDGDSLVYSLTEPLSTHTTEAVPDLAPAPYPLVKWREGFDLQHVVQGSPDLRVSRDGILTVTPTLEGLFVFAVKCEEFRKGEKIGEVRRDFQMFVVDKCSGGLNPRITGKKITDTNYQGGNISLHFPYLPDDQDDERCVDIVVTDDDYLTEGIERVKIRAVAIGFKEDVSDILPEVTRRSISLLNKEAKFQVCFDKCPYLDKPFQIAVIAEDDACSQPLLDTLMMTVTIEPPPNHKPKFIEPAVAVVTKTVDEAEPEIISWNLTGEDADNDLLTLTALKTFEYANVGMTQEEIENTPGRYKGRLSWDADCERYDFTERNNFPVTFLLEDQDQCEVNDPDTVIIDLTVALPSNTKPRIYISGYRPGDKQTGIERHLFDSLNLKVLALDSQDDIISLYVEGTTFDPKDYDVKFPFADNPLTAKSKVQTDFLWKLLCETVDLQERDEFVFRFIARDYQNKCRFKYADTVLLPVKVLPPINTKPLFTFANGNPETKLENNHLDVVRGKPIQLNFTSVDKDKAPLDKITIEMIEAKGNVEPKGYTFNSVTGTQSVTSPFTWAPDCSIFINKNYKNEYQFAFRTFDDRCQNAMGDTIILDVTVTDIFAATEDFLPPNVVTANGDGCNDFFSLEAYESNSSICQGVVTPNLPLDNCSGTFSSIRIYNRWGKEVFTSNIRSFKWDPSNEATGVYFYTIVYSHPEESNRVTEFKGSISVRN